MNDETSSAAPPEAAPATRSAEGAIEIDASPEQVWRALTDAAELERWFPLEARVEPGEGGVIWISWKNEYAGDCRILAWEPPRHLRTSWGWSEGGPTQMTDYEIEGRGGKTFLRVVTSGFPADASWDAWVEGTRLGWRYELASLKHYLERHAGEDRAVVYLRRRVPQSREDAWARVFGSGGFGDGFPVGHPFDVDPPVQYAAILDEPKDAMLRISMEPCYVDARDVTLWIAAWGESAKGLAAIESEWSERLERLFPEGAAP
jgi:uncharacterized protein YndB with AHSA1/START domain